MQTGQVLMYATERIDRTHAMPPPSEPDTLSSESNHRISNNLALLASAVSIRANQVSNRGKSMSSEEVSLILGEISARISTVAWLHRFLSKEPDAETVDLNAHLYQLGETLLSALSDPRRMTLLRTGEDECVVPTGKVIPLCLIVTEVLTNSLKYSHPTGVAGKVAIGCRREDGWLIVDVADDGVGLPEGFDFMADGGTGARTIRAVARQLGAVFSFESRPIGLLFTLRVPIDKIHPLTSA